MQSLLALFFSIASIAAPANEPNFSASCPALLGIEAFDLNLELKIRSEENKDVWIPVLAANLTKQKVLLAPLNPRYVEGRMGIKAPDSNVYRGNVNSEQDLYVIVTPRWNQIKVFTVVWGKMQEIRSCVLAQ